MLKFAKSTLGVVGVASMLLFSTGAASAATINHSEIPSASSTQKTPSKKSTDQVISEAKAKDLAGFQQKLKTIKTSAAFVDVVSKQTGNPDKALEFYAAISTPAQVQTLVKTTQGKHFVVAGTKENPKVSLAEGAPAKPSSGATTYDFPTCPQGWAAATAYFVATGMTCGALHFVGGVPGIICDGVFFTAGMLPDFNAPC